MNPYPPPPPAAPPPSRGNAGLWWAIGGAVLVLVLVAVLAVVALTARRGPSAETVAAPSSAADARCGIPGRSSRTPITDRVTAGPLSFPVSAAPGWEPQTGQAFSHGAEAVGLVQEVVAGVWQAHVEVGLTAFAPKLPAAVAAQRILACLADESAYTSYRPQLAGVNDAEAVTVDGVPAARVSARLLVERGGLPFPGDLVTVVVIDSAPQAYFESDTPIGDTALAAVAQQVFEQLKVARDV
ncbi:hypothetical protein ACXYTP_16915 [Tsukamurella ocularis]